MIQSVIYGLLGFLSATLLALMIAPAIWRRAVVLTRRQVEATVPMTLNELKAGKDQVRAEAAIAIRRLEIANRKLNEKSISLKADMGRRLEDIRLLNEENSEQADALEALEEELRLSAVKVQGLENEKGQLTSELTSACEQIEEKIRENEELARLYDEACLVSSNRQIDLVASQTKAEQLSSEIDSLKRHRGETEAQLREISAELKSAERELQLKTKKVSTLEKKVEQLMTGLTDAEERLDRREKEIARLKEKLNQMERASVRPAQVAAHGFGGEKTPMSANDDELKRKVGELEEDKDRLEKRLKKLVAENRRLKSQSDYDGAVQSGDKGAEERENAELRTQINHLAAEIVNLTAMLDGPNSEISQIIRQGKKQDDPSNRSASIADRVRALREAALASRSTRV